MLARDELRPIVVDLNQRRELKEIVESWRRSAMADLVEVVKVVAEQASVRRLVRNVGGSRRKQATVEAALANPVYVRLGQILATQTGPCGWLARRILRVRYLSIPDQRKQLVAWCGAKQWDVAAEFVEPGQSATDDKRPIFQQMIERACDGEHAFDVIIVHSYSRFFRDAFGQEFYLRKLAKAGVRLISITQPLGDDDDPAQAMMCKVIALFDEYQSKENGKHVLRSMKENARQGFWNGTTCPIGYKLVEVEKRGNRVKKKLDIDAVYSETVKLIFRLYLYGDGESGALGVKEVVKWLNARGYRTPRGKTFSVGPVHKVLTNPVYIGSWRFDLRSSKTGERKPEDEIIAIPVPAIIDQHTFEQVQRQLRARSPKVVAPRVTTGPILLTGLAVCATCGASMTLRTGTSSTGAVHRYYTCSACARSGKTACKDGRSGWTSSTG